MKGRKQIIPLLDMRCITNVRGQQKILDAKLAEQFGVHPQSIVRARKRSGLSREASNEETTRISVTLSQKAYEFACRFPNRSLLITSMLEHMADMQDARQSQSNANDK